MEHLLNLNFTEQVIFIAIVPFITFILNRVFLKDKLLIKILAQTITIIIVVMARLIRKYVKDHEDVGHHIENIKENMKALKIKVKKDKVEIG